MTVEGEEGPVSEGEASSEEEIAENKEEDKFESAFEACPYKIGEHVDCLDEVDKWRNAVIRAVENDKVLVHYTGWSDKYDAWIPFSSERILHQWTVGEELRVNNRLDVLDTLRKWLEAIVLEADEKRIRVHYRGYTAKWDEWIELDSDRIAPVGTHSDAEGAAKYEREDN